MLIKFVLIACFWDSGCTQIEFHSMESCIEAKKAVLAQTARGVLVCVAHD